MYVCVCVCVCVCLDGDSDSDSDLSIEDDQSGSYASTHSSDSEDGEGPYRPEECWENLASNGPKRPHLHGRRPHPLANPLFKIKQKR